MKYFKGYLLFTICYLLPSIANEGAIEGGKHPGARSKKQGVFSLLNLSFLLLILLMIGGCTSISSGESEIMRKLRESDSDRVFGEPRLIQASYFLYPSTMRMVNIDDMPNWNEAIKDVRRLSLCSMWPDRFDRAKQDEVVEDLKTKENFSLYAEMEDKYSNFKLLGRETGSEAVLIYNDSTANYVVHLLGKINYVKLMKLSADLRDKETRGTGIDFLMKAMGQDKERATRQRHYYDRRREIQAAEQLKKDSIEAAQGTETVITE